MKGFLILLAAAAMVTAQSLTLAATQVCSYPAEANNNAGGKGTCRIGKDPDYYKMLIRVTLGTQVPKMPCTLLCKQYAYTSGGVTYDWPSFETVVSSVPGTWENGTASETPQEGSACYNQRAYSATTPTYWVAGASGSTLGSVIKGQGGSHDNSAALTVETAASTLFSTAVLDERLVADLISGYGGLCISRAPSGGGEIRIYNRNIFLRWDPNGTTVNVEKYRMAAPMNRLTISPNPLSSATRISFDLPGRTAVQIYGINGSLLTTLPGKAGVAVWDGLDSRGRLLPNGVYVMKAGNERVVFTERLSILR